MTKKIVEFETYETVHYLGFIEVDVPDDDPTYDWEALKNDALINLYEADVYWEDYVIDRHDFTTKSIEDVGTLEENLDRPWVMSRLINKPLDK